MNLFATDAKGVSPQLFSGFVVRIEDDWLWFSAGHCVERICELASDRQSGFSLHAIAENPAIRIDFNPRSAVERHINDGRVDIGFVALQELYIDGLRAAGAVPIDITEVAWPAGSGGAYWAVGVPAESVRFGEVRELGRVMFGTPIAICLARQEDGDDDGLPFMTFDFDRSFYLVDGTPLRSVGGMSGSPVFAWMRDEEGKEHHVPVGVQWGWRSPNGPLFATPLAMMTRWLEQQLGPVDRDGGRAG